MHSSNINIAVPFFLVNDMEVSLTFYVGKLGFTLTNQWKPIDKTEWCWLKRDDVSIMLQEPRDKNQLNHREKGNGVSICFQCHDALTLYHEFVKNGVEIREPFVGNNMWVVCVSDPDGYKLDFESPTDAPEEITYSQWIMKN